MPRCFHGMRGKGPPPFPATRLLFVHRQEDTIMPRERFVPRVIQAGLCQLCGRCYNTCRNHAIVMRGQERFVDYDRCTGCLQCVLICPYNAITTTSVLEGETIAVKIDVEACNGCNECVAACPKGMFLPAAAGGRVAFTHERTGACKGCKACEHACKQGAIAVLTA